VALGGTHPMGPEAGPIGLIPIILMHVMALALSI
jgi:hypothetical protein